LVYLRGGFAARQPATAQFVDIEAQPVPDAGRQVGTVNAIITKQQIRHSLNWRRTIDLQFRYLVRTHVPALQDEPRIIEAMVIM